VQELDTRDALTGLFNKRYIVHRLDEEILRAISHQRPCALASVRVQNWSSIQGPLGPVGGAEVLKAMAEVLRSNIRSFDRVGRMDEAEFGVIMPEKNKRQAEEFAGQILERLSQMFQGREASQRPLFWVGVAENPIDGVDAASLLQKICVLFQQKTP
jgi:diguanylate cyclase (GGDEF)-like protein